MKVHLVNPSNLSFGIAVITPRWMFVLAAATPARWGDPVLSDETLEPLDPTSIERGDIVGISIQTGNATRGYEIGRLSRERGAWVVFGSIHATLYPDEATRLGGAHAVVRGDGDIAWAEVLDDCADCVPRPLYEGGRLEAAALRPARWDLIDRKRYAWASVQTVRGCPKHCSFCSVWRTDGQEPRQRAADVVVEEIVALRRLGFRFIALADDNFYPVTLDDLAQAARRQDPARLHQLEAMRAERFELMARLAELPDDLVFFTQITMEAAEDTAFLDAMRTARIEGALIGVEAVTPEGLKDVYKDFNVAGDALVTRLRQFRAHGVHVLGSFIFGLPSDQADTFDLTAALAKRSHLDFAQFVTLTPMPGTLDFETWERELPDDVPTVAGVPLSRYWLIPKAARPRVFTAHPSMGADEIRERTQRVWDQFYDLKTVWRRSTVVSGLRQRLTFVLMSKLYRQMYAGTGLAADSARESRATAWARLLARPVQRLFAAAPMPELQAPKINRAPRRPLNEVDSATEAPTSGSGKNCRFTTACSE